MNYLYSSNHNVIRIIFTFCISMVCLFYHQDIKAQNFSKGYRKYKKGKIEQAEKIFKKYQKHSVYDLGANYYLILIKNRKAKTLVEWSTADSALAAIERRYSLASSEKLAKLKKSKAGKNRVTSSRIRFQRRAIQLADRVGTIQLLDSVGRLFPDWIDRIEKEWDSTRSHVVNRNFPTSDYNITTSILNNHQDVVWPTHFEHIWEMEEEIWNLFRKKHSYCQMEIFRKDHPNEYFSKDCWFFFAKEALCDGSLESLLSFRADYPYSIFETEVLETILKQSEDEKAKNNLTSSDKKQLEDIYLYARLNSIVDGNHSDTMNLWRDLNYYFSTYAPRPSTIFLLQQSASYYFQNNGHQKARELLLYTRPFFPDTLVCSLNFGFKENFSNYQSCADKEPDSIRSNQIEELNTINFSEHSAVSWGEGNECYFARKVSKKTQIMHSVKRNGKWSEPESIAALSVSGVTIPLSITSDGLLMLLKSGSRLFISNRTDETSNWDKPRKLPLNLPSLGRAVLAPDGSAILFDAKYVSRNLRRKSNSNIYYCFLNPDGSCSKPTSLEKIINTNKKDINPYLCADGVTLFFCSEGHNGFGNLDAFVSRRKDNSWTSWTIPENLGCQINGPGDNFGFTWVAENTKSAFFTNAYKKNKDSDIWQIGLPSFARPTSVSRLKGVVVDSKGNFIKYGNVKATINLGKNWVNIPVLPNGRFYFVIPDSVFQIKLFVDVPGFYTPTEKVFTLNDFSGKTVRDTFTLISLDEIKKNFQVQYATFDENKANFNDSRVYKELELLCVFIKRMDSRLVIIGHTDSTGSPERNLQLSLERAETVRRYLIDTLGVPESRLSAEGRGSNEPKCANSTSEGRRCNRRVGIKFDIPTESIKRVQQEQKQAKESASQQYGAKANIGRNSISKQNTKQRPQSMAVMNKNGLEKHKRKKLWKKLFGWIRKDKQEDVSGEGGE